MTMLHLPFSLEGQIRLCSGIIHVLHQPLKQPIFFIHLYCYYKKWPTLAVTGTFYGEMSGLLDPWAFLFPPKHLIKHSTETRSDKITICLICQRGDGGRMFLHLLCGQLIQPLAVVLGSSLFHQWQWAVAKRGPPSEPCKSDWAAVKLLGSLLPQNWSLAVIWDLKLRSCILWHVRNLFMQTCKSL